MRADERPGTAAQSDTARCPDHHDHAYGDAETKRRALESGRPRLRERNQVLSKDKTRIWLARIIDPLADAPYRHRERVFNPDRKESRGRYPARRKPAYLTAGTGAAARPKSCMSRIPDRKNGTGCSRRGR